MRGRAWGLSPRVGSWEIRETESERTQWAKREREREIKLIWVGFVGFGFLFSRVLGWFFFFSFFFLSKNWKFFFFFFWLYVVTKKV